MTNCNLFRIPGYSIAMWAKSGKHTYENSAWLEPKAIKTPKVMRLAVLSMLGNMKDVKRLKAVTTDCIRLRIEHSVTGEVVFSGTCSEYLEGGAE